jgi:hypothetical protein
VKSPVGGRQRDREARDGGHAAHGASTSVGCIHSMLRWACTAAVDRTAWAGRLYRRGHAEGRPGGRERGRHAGDTHMLSTSAALCCTSPPPHVPRTSGAFWEGSCTARGVVSDGSTIQIKRLGTPHDADPRPPAPRDTPRSVVPNVSVMAEGGEAHARKSKQIARAPHQCESCSVQTW